MIINTNPIYYFTTNRLRLKVCIRSICINLIVNVIRLREMGKWKKNETSNITRTTLWFLKFELTVCVLGGWVPARIAIDIQMDRWKVNSFYAVDFVLKASAFAEAAMPAYHPNGAANRFSNDRVLDYMRILSTKRNPSHKSSRSKYTWLHFKGHIFLLIRYFFTFWSLFFHSFHSFSTHLPFQWRETMIWTNVELLEIADYAINSTGCRDLHLQQGKTNSVTKCFIGYSI